jgi:bacterioferritin
MLIPSIGGTMKGNEQLIVTLNSLLADELTATNQYIVHSELCANWGYEKLHDVIEKRAIDEMKHAEKHIARILYLEGKPIVSDLKKINIGDTVDKQFENDLVAEVGAVKAYNAAIKQANDAGDQGTGDMLKMILLDEEAHIDWLEAQLDQIQQMGLENYLTEQL